MDVAKKLADLGVRKYTSFEIQQKYKEILETLKSPTKKHHEVIDTGINLVTPGEWKKVPAGKAIACAFAGTNWVVAIVEKNKEGKVTVSKLGKKKMAPKTLTFRGLVQLMVQTIIEAATEKEADVSEIKAIGISLGFPQFNVRVEKGIDARLTSESNRKGWRFVEKLNLPFEKDSSLGNLLLSELEKRDNQLKVKHFAFKNDAQAVAEDGQTFNGNILPVGFVFGTGVNGAIGSVNFEFGKFSIEIDPIIKHMKEMVPVSDPDIYQEYLMGGNYIRYRVAAAIDLLSEAGLISSGKEIAQAIIQSKDDKLMSRLASADSLEEIRETLRFDIKPQDSANVLQLTCITALAQAGQLMGINLAALAIAAGYKIPNEAVIPIEGSVFWKGYGVKESAKETMNQILPGNKLVVKEASGLRGVGKVALAQTVL